MARRRGEEKGIACTNRACRVVGIMIFCGGLVSLVGIFSPLLLSTVMLEETREGLLMVGQKRERVRETDQHH